MPSRAEDRALHAVPPPTSRRAAPPCRRLRKYNGLTTRHPLLLAIRGRVLDVRTGADYYGVGGPYQKLAGRDASKAFAMMSLRAEDAHDDLTGVPEEHLKILDDWYDKLTKKYPTVGRVAQDYSKRPPGAKAPRPVQPPVPVDPREEGETPVPGLGSNIAATGGRPLPTEKKRK